MIQAKVICIGIVRLLLLITVSAVANVKLPYRGFFPYKEIVESTGWPRFITAWANFDGVHYISIAQMGYNTYEQAFFPLYSLSIRYLSSIFAANYFFTSLIISNVSFMAGLIFFIFWCRKHLGGNFWWVAAFLLSFPTAFFFSMSYTEGLFFLTLFVALYYLQAQKYWLVIFAAILSSLTKLTGIFLVIPLFFQLKNAKIPWSKKILVILSPFLGLAAYCIYLWKTTGDPLFFFNAQPVFGANRSTSLIFLPQVYWRYLKILLTASHDFAYFIALFEVVTFTVIFVVCFIELYRCGRTKSRLQQAMAIFSLMILILPTLTGTFSSIPRYGLFCFSFFFFLARLKNFYLKIAIIAFFVVVQVIVFSFFIQGYFVA